MSTPLENPNTGVLPKILGFSLVLTLIFTGVANMLPQIEGEAPVDKEIDLGILTPESFAALGESLFMGKGTCTLCHKPAPLGRAPDIAGENMLEVAEQRLKDKRYQGKAKTAEEYMRESMIEPSKYVVKGWGVSGSNDTISPMPVVNAAPIELSDIEINAVIAYLQHKDGNDITVELPTEAPASVEKSTKKGGGGLMVSITPAKTAEEAIKKYGCQACHSMLGTKATIAPSLEDVASRLTREQIGQSILEPSAVIAEGFSDMMPKDFGEKMTVKELSMIVDLLSTQSKEKSGTAVETSSEIKIEKKATSKADAKENEK